MLNKYRIARRHNDNRSDNFIVIQILYIR
ncbi:hypothetical protein KSF78_0007740 [Schistosoma japonicum]|nr:hypothetical protein KSF78_0007740 [Schistosoma japonicum]